MRRLFPTLARLWDLVPCTGAGLLLALVAGGLLWWLGLGRRDLVALMYSLVVLALELLFALLTTVAAIWLRRRLPRVSQVSRLDLQAGIEYRSGFLVPYPRLPFVTVKWDWKGAVPVRIDCPRGNRCLEERVTAERRGLTERLRRRYRVGDFLGLTEIAFSLDYPTTVQVVPHPGNLAHLTLGVHLAAGETLSDPRGRPEGDRTDMRGYVVGDAPNRVLWKVFSRSGQLMVRTAERAVEAQPRACLYFVSGPTDEPGAALCRVFLERGLLGYNWRFGTDGSVGFASRVPEGLVMLARSGNPGEAEHTGLAAFLAQAEQAGFELCLVVIPPAPTPKHAMALEAVRRTRMKIRLCIAVDRIDQSEDEPPFPLFSPDDRDGPSLAEMTRVARVWKGARNEPLVVDRQRGGVVSGLLTFLGRTTWP